MVTSKVVLITGTSSGFGRDAALALARRGHHVVATMRDSAGKNAGVAAELHRAAESENLPLRVLDLDVTDAATITSAVADVMAREGRIDVLVNNAGTMPLGVTEAFSAEQLSALLDTNVVGAFRMVQAVLPHMRGAGSGRLVHLSSIAGRFAFPFAGIYHASKFGLEGLMEGLGYEVSAFGIESVIVEAGPFKTNLFSAGAKPERHDVLASYGATAERCVQFLGGFEHMFAAPEMADAVDPKHVVDVLVDVVERAPGTCPQRVPVGLTFGLAELNTAIHGFERGALEAMRVGDLAARTA